MQENYPTYNTQSEMYATLIADYNLTKELDRFTDYFQVDEIEGIIYYTPNDEDWGAIIAVDHTNKLAIDTGFYEMDDMAANDSDYAQVCSEGQLMCRFEV